MTTIADRLFLDTNVLLAATDEGRDEHLAARAALEDWPAAGIAVYISVQVVREYLCVATRPEANNGLGLDASDALMNVRAFRARFHVLEDSGKVSDRLLALLDAIECRGKQVHDANIVATMSTHGIKTLVTLNVDDFARFADRIEICSLTSELSG